MYVLPEFSKFNICARVYLDLIYVLPEFTKFDICAAKFAKFNMCC